MSPKELAEALRAVAQKIDNSVQPSRSLIASELRQLLAGVQTAALNPEDVQGLRETIEKLNALISNENASDKDIEAAIARLQEVKNSAKRTRMKEQLNPKAAPVPLRSIHDQPLTRKTGSIHWGDDGC